MESPKHIDFAFHNSNFLYNLCLFIYLLNSVKCRHLKVNFLIMLLTLAASRQTPFLVLSLFPDSSHITLLTLLVY